MKPSIFQRVCYRSTAYLKSNSATILTCIGAIGVVATTVTAVKATPKALMLLSDAAYEKKDNLTTFEKIKVVTPVYSLALFMGSATIVCIFGANVLNKQKQASMVSAYALLSNYHKAYRNKLIELHGEEVDKEVRAAVVRSNCSYHQINVDVPDEKVIFYESISGESICRYEREIMDAEYHLNRNFVLRGYASLNEFYEFLGLPKTDYGEELGWTLYDGYYWIDFEHRLVSRDDGGTPVYSIDMIFSPEPDYMRDWD